MKVSFIVVIETADTELSAHKGWEQVIKEKLSKYLFLAEVVSVKLMKENEGVVQVKWGSILRTGNLDATPQYEGEHGCRTYIGECDTQGKPVGPGRVCMAPEVVIHDGRMYCQRHQPAESREEERRSWTLPRRMTW